MQLRTFVWNPKYRKHVQFHLIDFILFRYLLLFIHCAIILKFQCFCLLNDWLIDCFFNLFIAADWASDINLRLTNWSGMSFVWWFRSAPSLSLAQNSNVLLHDAIKNYKRAFDRRSKCEWLSASVVAFLKTDPGSTPFSRSFSDYVAFNFQG